MELYPINIKGQEFKVAIADSDSTRSKGLGGLKRLGKNKGMLFIFPTAERMYMVMTDMNFDLDFVFLDKEWNIVDTGFLSKGDETGLAPSVPCHMVLELPAGSVNRLKLYSGESIKPTKEINTHFEGVKKFKSGGRFEMIGDKLYKIKIDDVEADPNMLQILNDKGEVVANIDSGSRIFSREHTAEMIKKYKKGDKLALAEYMIEVLDIQDNQEQDYVTTDA